MIFNERRGWRGWRGRESIEAVSHQDAIITESRELKYSSLLCVTHVEFASCVRPCSLPVYLLSTLRINPTYLPTPSYVRLCPCGPPIVKLSSLRLVSSHSAAMNTRTRRHTRAIQYPRIRVPLASNIFPLFPLFFFSFSSLITSEAVLYGWRNSRKLYLRLSNWNFDVLRL